MGKTNAVWGIDIGACALKALRCRLARDGKTIQAEAFDYIEYPKILTQPDAEPGRLVGEALSQFHSRHAIRGDTVAVSLPSQSGLARIVRLPPVEEKKVREIVLFEARQNIPFPLDDVCWDYQQLPGGAVERGFALEADVILAAMKREQVQRAIAPYEAAGIKLGIAQLPALAIHNFAAYDALDETPDFDPEKPPASVAIVSLGTDTTELVITNGCRLWMRSVAIGGNHFTKALTKELRLTFAKAEHLKRNARTAADPRALFAAMRPVFQDFATELQRSIGYFQSVNRRAEISHMLLLGNPSKLPGIAKYLEQNFSMNVKVLDHFERLTGEAAGVKEFQDNLSSFAICYGLAVQTLGKAALRTNLIPHRDVLDQFDKTGSPWLTIAARPLVVAKLLAKGAKSFWGRMGNTGR